MDRETNEHLKRTIAFLQDTKARGEKYWSGGREAYLQQLLDEQRALIEESADAAKLRKLLNRLDHAVALWDADDPMGAYQVLVQSIRDARE